MHKLKYIAFLSMLILSNFVLASDQENTLQVTAFFYEELEEGAGKVDMRYLVGEDYLRIDYGNSQDDFILYDRKAETVYSVNKQDETILFINKHSWALPSFDFERKTIVNELANAPRIGGKLLKNFQLKAGNDSCTEVQLIPGVYAKEMAVFKSYQGILSGQQVKLLQNTPQEMQSPCFLVDQIYNAGEYYDMGLPVQEWHSRGYAKILTNYRQMQVPAHLFNLPEKYHRYSAFSAAD